MVNLEQQDRTDLITLLANLNDLAMPEDRRVVLENAGLADLIPHINLSGNAYIGVSTIVSYLSNYGALSNNKEALGQFLSVVKSFVGPGDQQFLDMLIAKYNMAAPVAVGGYVQQWNGDQTGQLVLEKVIGENTLHPIAFLAEALVVADSVAFVNVPTGAGTGYMVTPDLLITNHHVLPDASLLPMTVFRFNFEDDWTGHAQPVTEYNAKVGGIFHTNDALDYTLVQLDSTPGQQWKWLPLRQRIVKTNDRVSIIQHAGGLPKRVSIQNNFVEYVGGHVLQYITTTLPGSSGSPVFNDQWEVVGLHHGGGSAVEPTTQRSYYRNEGILITDILNDLPAQLRQQIDAAAR